MKPTFTLHEGRRRDRRSRLVVGSISFCAFFVIGFYLGYHW